MATAQSVKAPKKAPKKTRDPLFSDEMYGGNEIRKGTSLAKFKGFIQNCFII
ncbi:MAG: hypothetical protein RI976_402 [Actinomycetota bacterium]